MNSDGDRDVTAAKETETHGAQRRDEALLDQALAETFPASDPIAPAVEARAPAAEVQDAGPSEKAVASARWPRRAKRVAPALIAVGALAVTLTAVRRIRSGQNAHKVRG